MTYASPARKLNWIDQGFPGHPSLSIATINWSNDLSIGLFCLDPDYLLFWFLDTDVMGAHIADCHIYAARIYRPESGHCEVPTKHDAFATSSRQCVL
jgi:hypothetical protein